MKRSGFITMWIIAVFLGFWFYKAHLVKQYVTEKLNELEKENPHYSFKYEGLATSGFPLSTDVTIKNPKFIFKDPNSTEESKVFIDGNLIVGSNIQGSQFWLKTKGDLHAESADAGRSFASSPLTAVLSSSNVKHIIGLKESLEKQTGRNLVFSGDQTFTFTVPDYHFTKAFPESFYHDDVLAIFKDILNKGEYYGSHTTLKGYNTPERLIPIYDGDSFHIGWKTTSKDKDLKQFTYRLEGKGSDALLKEFRKNNPSIPDPGTQSLLMEGSLVFDPNLPWGEPLQLLGRLHSIPLSFDISKYEYSDKFDHISTNFKFAITPDEAVKKLNIVLDTKYAGKFSKEGFEAYLFKVSELIKQAKAEAPQDEKEFYDSFPKLLNELTPKYYEWGNITSDVEINAALQTSPIPYLPENVEIKHFDFLAGDAGAKVNGSFKFQPDVNGTVVVDMLNYRALFEGLANYYNLVHKSLESTLNLPVSDYARPISSATVDEIVNVVKTLSDDSEKAGKDARITILVPPDFQVTVGGKKLQDVIPILQTLEAKVQAEVMPAPKETLPKPASAKEEPKAEEKASEDTLEALPKPASVKEDQKVEEKVPSEK